MDIHVMIVDDEETMRSVFSQVLAEDGYRVSEAASGEEALQLFQADMPDIVITDIRMGGISGIELLQEIKKLNTDIQVIIISSHASVELAITALRVGAYDYLLKPIEELDIITSTVYRAAEKIKLTTENRSLVERLSAVNTALTTAHNAQAGLLLENQNYQQNLEQLVEERTSQIQASQSRLIQAHKLASIGMLASGIAHEINNPNNYIAYNTELLTGIWNDALPVLTSYAEKQPDMTLGGLPFHEVSTVASRLLAGLANGSQRISKIVSQLKQYARPASDADPAGFEINQAVQSAVTLLDFHIRRTTDFFSTEYGNDLPPVQGVIQQIEQVLINLISNALNALTERSQKVLVGTAYDRVNNEVVITVSDEGHGMTAEVMSRLKEPFFSTRYSSGGTGLGLSICDTILQEHEGSLDFESLPGKGTSAIVRLKPVYKGNLP